jgi:hypothetical protein
MRKTKLALVLFSAHVLGACSSGQSDTPEDAKGETNIRYVICGTGGYGCFVAARFKDMDGCESHKRWSVMLCDSISEPGKMICTRDTGPQVSSAYCTL